MIVFFKAESMFKNILVVIGLGLVLGFLAKYLDGTSVGNIGTLLGPWVFLTTIIAVYSETPRQAGIYSFLFLASMLVSYYVYSMMLFGFFPTSYFLTWGTIACLSFIGGWIVWFARGEGWWAAGVGSLPISVIIAEGYPFWYTFRLELGIDWVLVLGLLVTFSHSWPKLCRILFITMVVVIIIMFSRLLYYLPLG